MAFMRPVTPSLLKQIDNGDGYADDADNDTDADDECSCASLPIGAVRVDPLVQALPHYQVVAVKAGGEEQAVPVFSGKIKTGGLRMMGKERKGSQQPSQSASIFDRKKTWIMGR